MLEKFKKIRQYLNYIGNKPITLGSKPVRISYSRYNAYTFCPENFKKIYIDQLYSAVNERISFGHSLHNSLALFHKPGETARHTYEKLLDCYNTAWESDGFNNAEDILKFYNLGKTILKHYYERIKDSNTKILFTEHRFDIKLGRHSFTGTIDKIQLNKNVLEVVDYKTFKNDNEEAKQNITTQLIAYYYAVTQMFQGMQVKAGVHYLYSDEIEFLNLDNTAIKNELRKLKKTAAKIAKKDFTPNTANCPRCLFKKKCVYNKKI